MNFTEGLKWLLKGKDERRYLISSDGKIKLRVNEDGSLAHHTQVDKGDLIPNNVCAVYIQFSQIEWEKAIKWEDVKEDTPICVWSSHSANFFLRHFQKYENGRVYCYPSGKTSCTWNGESSYYPYELSYDEKKCSVATEEQILKHKKRMMEWAKAKEKREQC